MDPRFLRARVRHELLPLLQALSPGIVDHLNGLADDLRARARFAWPSRRSRRHARARGASDSRGGSSPRSSPRHRNSNRPDRQRRSP
jgi:tRNA(Ile)-lysidine synthase TilS/MesJ